MGVEALTSQQHAVPYEPTGPWKCFHCDYVAETIEQAREHFGPNPVAAETPVCVEASTKDLQSLVATNREMWERLQKEMSENENLDFQVGCWEEVGRKLTGKTNANWHDFAAGGQALYQKENERRLRSEEMLSHLIEYFLNSAPVLLHMAFDAKDKQLVKPDEYLLRLKDPL